MATVLTQGRTLPAPHRCSISAENYAPPLIEGIEPIQKGIIAALGAGVRNICKACLLWIHAVGINCSKNCLSF